MSEQLTSGLQMWHQHRPKVEILVTLQVTKSTVLFVRVCLADTTTAAHLHSPPTCSTRWQSWCWCSLVFDGGGLQLMLSGEGRERIIPQWPLSSQQFTGIPWLIDHATPESSSPN